MKIGRGAHLVERSKKDDDKQPVKMVASWSELALAMGMPEPDPKDDSAQRRVPALA